MIMNWFQKHKGISVIVLVFFIGLMVFFFDKKPAIQPSGQQDNVLSVPQVENIETQVDDTLDVLMRIHYVSTTDKPLSGPDSVILDMLQESMNDLNKLKGLVYKTEILSKSQNEIIATTGLVLNVSVLELINAYSGWIEYLRKVDINNVGVSEFQYQLALFQTSTHDTYLKLVEGASLLPMITVQFAKEDGGKNSIDEDLKNHFVSKIDDLFGDILIADDLFHKETNSRYAIAVLIRNYNNFLISADKTP